LPRRATCTAAGATTGAAATRAATWPGIIFSLGYFTVTVAVPTAKQPSGIEATAWSATTTAAARSCSTGSSSSAALEVRHQLFLHHLAVLVLVDVRKRSLRESAATPAARRLGACALAHGYDASH
jgi:hypothetical protein